MNELKAKLQERERALAHLQQHRTQPVNREETNEMNILRDKLEDKERELQQLRSQSNRDQTVELNSLKQKLKQRDNDLLSIQEANQMSRERYSKVI